MNSVMEQYENEQRLESLSQDYDPFDDSHLYKRRNNVTSKAVEQPTRIYDSQKIFIATITEAHVNKDTFGNCLEITYDCLSLDGIIKTTVIDNQYESGKPLWRKKMREFIIALKLLLKGDYTLETIPPMLIGIQLLVSVTIDNLQNKANNVRYMVDNYSDNIYYPISFLENLGGNLESQKPYIMILTKVAGVTYGNRQNTIQHLQVNQELELIRETTNEFDKNAISIHSPLGQIGYIPKEIARQISADLDTGKSYKCYITQITRSSFTNRGVNIKLIKQEKVEEKVKSEEESASYTTTTESTNLKIPLIIIGIIALVLLILCLTQI